MQRKNGEADMETARLRGDEMERVRSREPNIQTKRNICFVL